MVTCICVIEKVLESIMNIRMAIMAAVISSTAVFTAHGVDVAIPGANPKMPAVVYSDNIVNQTNVDELRKDLSALYDKKRASEGPVANQNASKATVLDKVLLIIRHITIVLPFMCYLGKIALFNLSCQAHLI